MCRGEKRGRVGWGVGQGNDGCAEVRWVQMREWREGRGRGWVGCRWDCWKGWVGSGLGKTEGGRKGEGIRGGSHAKKNVFF